MHRHGTTDVGHLGNCSSDHFAVHAAISAGASEAARGSGGADGSEAEVGRQREVPTPCLRRGARIRTICPSRCSFPPGSEINCTVLRCSSFMLSKKLVAPGTDCRWCTWEHICSILYCISSRRVRRFCPSVGRRGADNFFSRNSC